MNHATDSCAGIDELLLDFAYGELAAAERRSVEGHLSGCERCRAELDGMMGTRRMMQALQPEPVPAAGVESLLAYAQQATARQHAEPPRRRWLSWLLPAVPVGGLLLAVLTVVSRQNDPSKVLALSEAHESAPPAAAVAVQKPAPIVAPAEPDAQLAAPAEVRDAKGGGGLLAKKEQSPAPAKVLDEGGGGGSDSGTLLDRRRAYRTASREKAAKSKDSASGLGAVATSVAQPAGAGFGQSQPPPPPAQPPAPRRLNGSDLANAAEAAKAKRAELWAPEPSPGAGPPAAAAAPADDVAGVDSLSRPPARAPAPATRERARADVATIASEERAAREEAEAERVTADEAAEKKAVSTGRIGAGNTFLVQMVAARAAANRGEHLGAVEHAVRALGSATSEEERRGARVLIADEARLFLADHPGHARTAELRTVRARALEALGRYSEARAEWAALENDRKIGGEARKSAAEVPAAAPVPAEADDAFSR